MYEKERKEFSNRNRMVPPETGRRKESFQKEKKGIEYFKNRKKPKKNERGR